MSEWTEQEIRTVYSDILRKIRASEEFRALALRDALAAFEQVSGRRLPDGLQLCFVVSDQGQVEAIVKSENGGKLSDSALQQVAGGVHPDLYAHFADVFGAEKGDTIEKWRI